MLTLIGSPRLLIFGFIHFRWPGRLMSIISSSGQDVTAEAHIIRQLWKGGDSVCSVLSGLEPGSGVSEGGGTATDRARVCLSPACCCSTSCHSCQPLTFPFWETGDQRGPEGTRGWTWLSSFERILTSLMPSWCWGTEGDSGSSWNQGGHPPGVVGQVTFSDLLV